MEVLEFYTFYKFIQEYTMIYIKKKKIMSVLKLNETIIIS